MAIQNGINNLLGTLAVGSGAIKHFKTQGLSARASSLSQVAHTQREVAGMEDDALKAEENYNAAVELGNELEQSKANMSEWAYNYSREQADKWIQQYGKQKDDFMARLDTLEKQLDVQDKIENVTKKGWLSK